LSNTSAKWAAADDYPIGLPREVVDTIIAQLDQHWGTENIASLVVPSRAHDERFRRWYAKYTRAATRPRAVLAMLQALSEIDARPLLPQVQTPTLILHRRNYTFMPIGHGRYLAEHIPGAKLIELPGSEPSLIWEDQQLAVDHLEEFLTGIRHSPDSTRVLAAVLFTDIVGSTEQAGRLGDRRWRELLNVHDELAGRLVEEAGGRLIKTTGDGILATFDGPGRGIHCAAAFRNQLRGIGVELRAGLHIGEVELRDRDVGGMAVHVAARIMAAAGAGEILTSRTVRDLMVGSDVVLEPRGSQSLKGVDGMWELSTVTRA
jgi:class 3 adenylate cyclase